MKKPLVSPLVSLLFALSFVPACSKSEDASLGSVKIGASASAAPSSAPSAPSASGTPSAATSASGGAKADPTGAPRAFAGKYTSEKGTLFVPGKDDVPNPQDWAGTTFRGEASDIGLGEGKLDVTIDPATGRVSGASEGPLGPLVVSGYLANDTFTATLTPKEPKVDSLYGTAIGKRQGAKIEGTMHLSLATGNVLRTAAFTLEGK